MRQARTGGKGTGPHQRVVTKEVALGPRPQRKATAKVGAIDFGREGLQPLPEGIAPKHPRHCLDQAQPWLDRQSVGHQGHAFRAHDAVGIQDQHRVMVVPVRRHPVADVAGLVIGVVCPSAVVNRQARMGAPRGMDCRLFGLNCDSVAAVGQHMQRIPMPSLAGETRQKSEGVADGRSRRLAIHRQQDRDRQAVQGLNLGPGSPEQTKCRGGGGQDHPVERKDSDGDQSGLGHGKLPIDHEPAKTDPGQGQRHAKRQDQHSQTDSAHRLRRAEAGGGGIGEGRMQGLVRHRQRQSWLDLA